MTTDFKRSGDIIFIVGNTNGEMGGSLYSYLKTGKSGNRASGIAPKLNMQLAVKLYNTLYRAIKSGLISSCHDLSDGGLGAAIAESALGGRLGASVFLDGIPGENTDKMENYRLLFCESPSRFLISIDRSKVSDFNILFKNLPFSKIGTVSSDSKVIVRRKGVKVLSITVDEIERAFKSAF